MVTFVMLVLTKRADYAMRLMLELAAHPGRSLTTAQIAESQRMPYEFLRKVARGLAEKGLILAGRGAQGGLQLARPAHLISLLDILRAAEAPAFSLCVADPESCEMHDSCVIRPVWVHAQRQFERQIGATLLSELADRRGRAPGRRTQPGHSTGRSREAVQPAPKRDARSPIARGPGDMSPRARRTNTVSSMKPSRGGTRNG